MIFRAGNLETFRSEMCIFEGDTEFLSIQMNLIEVSIKDDLDIVDRPSAEPTSPTIRELSDASDRAAN